MRMANEIDRGQEAGEVAKQGDPQGPGVSQADLGVSSQRVAEWRELRDAGEQVVEAVQALSPGSPAFGAERFLCPARISPVEARRIGVRGALAFDLFTRVARCRIVVPVG